VPILEKPIKIIKLAPKIFEIKKKEERPIVTIKSSSSESERLDTATRLKEYEA